MREHQELGWAERGNKVLLPGVGRYTLGAPLDLDWDLLCRKEMVKPIVGHWHWLPGNLRDWVKGTVDECEQEGERGWCYCAEVESDDLETLRCSKCGNAIKPVGGGV